MNKFIKENMPPILGLPLSALVLVLAFIVRWFLPYSFILKHRKVYKFYEDLDMLGRP